MIDDADDLYLDTSETTVAARPAGKRRAIDGPLRNTYRVIRDDYKRQCGAARLPCSICHQKINYALPHGDPGAFELDHIQSVEVHPELALVASNFQPSHSVCNKRRGLLQGLKVTTATTRVMVGRRSRCSCVLTAPSSTMSIRRTFMIRPKAVRRKRGDDGYRECRWIALTLPA